MVPISLSVRAYYVQYLKAAGLSDHDEVYCSFMHALQLIKLLLHDGACALLVYIVQLRILVYYVAIALVVPFECIYDIENNRTQI